MLAGELAESTERMSRLVGAVKRYAYMDRGGLMDVDVHEDLDTTLTILGHKLKHTGIVVERAYDPALPRISAFGAELNQVWTNLLDNAIDALGETGTITISTRRDGSCIEVDLADDGPGIPRGYPRAGLRPLLHDQGGRPWHRSRPRHGKADRRRSPPWQPDAPDTAGRRLAVPRKAARRAARLRRVSGLGAKPPRVEAVDAAAGRPLRGTVLRPGRPLSELFFDADEDPRSGHYAVRAEGRIVGVATVMPDGHPRDPRPGDWRIRGMAVEEAYRGAGIGGALLAACEAHARRGGGSRLWCNARTGARNLYLRGGLHIEGEEFEIPGIGPHFLMSMALDWKRRPASTIVGHVRNPDQHCRACRGNAAA